MASPIQGSGGIHLPFSGSDQVSKVTTPGQVFGRSINQTPGESVFQQSDTEQTSEVSKKELTQRKITGLTSEGLKQIGGDPNSSIFKAKSSPGYRKLLDSLDKLEQAKNSSASFEQKTEILDEIIGHGETFALKKAEESNNAKGAHLTKILARMTSAEIVVQEAKATKIVLQLQQPNSGHVINNALLTEAADFNDAVLQSALVNNPPEDVDSLVNLRDLYSDKNLLEQHFNDVVDPKKGRKLLLNQQTSGVLRNIGAAHWAKGKVAKEVPALPANIQQLKTQWNNLQQKLTQQKVPLVGILAARTELFNVSTAKWAENAAVVPSETGGPDAKLYVNVRSKTLYVDAPEVNAKKPPPTRFQIQTIVAKSHQLAGGFTNISAEFQINTAENKLKPDTINDYNQLPKPAFTTAENNMLHKDGFAENTKARFTGREKDILPCPAHCVVKSNGEPIYHANNVQMPLSNFIAAQGPRQESAALFWQMVDTQGSEVVVDLTNGTDPSVNKRSHSYTPEPGKTQTYPNGTTVTNNGEAMVMNGLFTIQQLEVNGKPHVRIQHNCFNDRTSGSPADLAALAVLVRTISPDLSLPVTVHCTAGVGRTSTFISVMDQTDHMANGMQRDVTESAAILRNARGPKAIQTPTQWHTINQAHDHADEIIAPFLQAASRSNPAG